MKEIKLIGKDGKITTLTLSSEQRMFTGLKDKNGKDIWEGDIVKFTSWPRGIDVVGIDVVTMERFPKYWLKDETFGYEGEGLVDPKESEVIGNIYENPELIKSL